ncbi:2-phospho-L-lactate transferase [Mesorhizobium marinum]|uniref:2-phospho-L-lactate transferase n=1 Tax=Mesorhizobium marinum TaxID=3228790 RepID=UPI0034670CDD
MTAAASTITTKGRVVALCGGVGGAKLAFGLARILGDRLTVVVNTGDDFEHLGLHISPDLDTVLYTLSGLANRELGWGRGDESWNFMSVLEDLGAETWFRLGDRDLALHVERTRQLRAGVALTGIIAAFAKRFGIEAEILPMSDEKVSTTVVTPEGALPFQRYFVERRCAPVVREIRFDGADKAQPTAQVRAALGDPGLEAVVICPSNPFLSIDPILAVPGMRRLLQDAGAPVVAVSPIIGGKAVKGPTGKIMAELGLAATNMAIGDHYRGLVSGLVIDSGDAAERGAIDGPTHATATLMSTDDDRERLAREALGFALRLAAAKAAAT